MVIKKIELNENDNKELAERILVRLLNQGEAEITHVLSKLFPNAPVMRVKSMANDFASKRDTSGTEFSNLLETDPVDTEIFEMLSGANLNIPLLATRADYTPTRFKMELICKRTPFKEFFDECKNITCEECITSRILKFDTDNSYSTNPWSLKIEKVEQRRPNLCIKCGKILNEKDELNLQKERLLYKCSYCGHKGWTRAK